MIYNFDKLVSISCGGGWFDSICTFWCVHPGFGVRAISFLFKSNVMWGKYAIVRFGVAVILNPRSLRLWWSFCHICLPVKAGCR